MIEYITRTIERFDKWLDEIIEKYDLDQKHPDFKNHNYDFDARLSASLRSRETDSRIVI